MEKSKVYSYHRFFYPFSLKKNTDNKGTDICKHFEKNTVWVKEESYKEKVERGIKEASQKGLEEAKEEYRKAYASYQYFNRNARKLFMGENSKSVAQYQIPLGKNEKNDNLLYIYPKNENEGIMLNLEEVTLRLFETEVGILEFSLCLSKDELERVLESKMEYKENLDVINTINERFRRVSLPFITNIRPHPVMPVKTELIIGDVKITEDFKSHLDELNSDDKFSEKAKQFPLNYVSTVIRELLALGGDGKFTVKDIESEKGEESEVVIEPVLDDRMFTMCIIRDNEASNVLKKAVDSLDQPINGLHPSSEDEVWLEELYKLLFIEESITCPNPYRRREILKRSVYKRWSSWGTIYGITHHSMVSVTGEDDSLFDTVIHPFNRLYTKIAMIHLLQRTSISTFARRAGELAGRCNHKSEKQNNDNEKDVNNPVTFIESVSSLKTDYGSFLNSIMIFELTSQEQGIEITQMFQEQLYIKEEKRELDHQIQNLYQIASAKSDQLEINEEKRLNATLGIFAIISIIVALVQTIWGLPENYKNLPLWGMILVVLVIAIYMNRKAIVPKLIK